MQTERPQTLYRQRLVRELEALRPARLLEVGCGGGGFLRSVAHLGIELRGVDPNAASLTPLRDNGFDVQVGRAEQLDFPSGSFDAVVFCFTAHHIEDWSQALVEALRVSATSVLLLDPWYEPGIASQAVAERFDRWCKAIDRAGGMVHNDCLSAGDLLAPIQTRLPAYELRLEYLLMLHELGAARLDEIAHEQLCNARDRSSWLPERDTIVELAQRDGFSDDGAILLSLNKRPAR